MQNRGADGFDEKTLHRGVVRVRDQQGLIGPQQKLCLPRPDGMKKGAVSRIWCADALREGCQ